MAINILDDLPDSGQPADPPDSSDPADSAGEPVQMTYSEALWIGITTVHYQVFGHPRADYSRAQLLAGMNILWIEYLRVKLDESGM